MKPIETSQVKLRRIHVKVDGTIATPVASGVDQYLVGSVVDNGVGDYTIVLTDKSKPKYANNLDVISIVPIGAFALFNVVAVTPSSVRIAFFDETGAAQDTAFGVEIQANDNRFLTSF